MELSRLSHFAESCREVLSISNATFVTLTLTLIDTELTSAQQAGRGMDLANILRG